MKICANEKKASDFDFRQGFSLRLDRKHKTISLCLLDGRNGLYFDDAGDDKMLFKCVKTRTDFFVLTRFISVLTKTIIDYKNFEDEEEKEDWRCTFLPKTKK